MENSQGKFATDHTIHAAAAALLDRAFLFLEDGKWRRANAYCERALDLEPRCGEAYLAKLMAERKVKKRELLAECLKPIEKSRQYKKIQRFGDDALKAELNGYIEDRKAILPEIKKKRRKKFLICAAFTAACLVLALLAFASITQVVINRRLKQADVGDIVTLGRYEQDGNRLNGKEPVEWLVVEAEGNERVLVALKGLRPLPFHNEAGETSWEDCSSRTWLNGKFLESTFNPIVRKFLCEKEVSADPNPDYDVDAGNPTWDKVYLLSCAEAETYFTDESQLICYATQYAKNIGSTVDESGACWWFLRTPGMRTARRMCVDTDGTMYSYGESAGGRHGTMRPAITVRVS